MRLNKSVWLCLFLAIGCLGPIFGLAAPSLEYLSASQLAAEMSGDDRPLLLDVRTEVEYVNGHIPGAVFLPLSQVERVSAMAQLDDRLVVYCSASECQSSVEAAAEMIDAGFTAVRVLDGGFPAWEKAGYEIAQGPESGEFSSGIAPDSIALGAVIGVGLADGINPCAIGMLVFLLGYLIIFAKQPGRVLGTGIIYIATVFATYFIIGLLFYQVLLAFSQTPEYAVVSNLIHLVLGGILVVTGIINLKDFFWPGVGFSLEIPKYIRPYLQGWVAKATTLSTVVLGVLVTVFEMPCSLPLYAGMLDILSRSELTKIATVGYLGLYNLMFILPLLVILAVVYSGKKITLVKEWEHRSKKWMKLLMGSMLVGFGIWLLLT